MSVLRFTHQKNIAKYWNKLYIFYPAKLHAKRQQKYSATHSLSQLNHLSTFLVVTLIQTKLKPCCICFLNLSRYLTAAYSSSNSTKTLELELLYCIIVKRKKSRFACSCEFCCLLLSDKRKQTSWKVLREKAEKSEKRYVTLRIYHQLCTSLHIFPYTTLVACVRMQPHFIYKSIFRFSVRGILGGNRKYARLTLLAIFILIHSVWATTWLSGLYSASQPGQKEKSSAVGWKWRNWKAWRVECRVTT